MVDIDIWTNYRTIQGPTDTTPNLTTRVRTTTFLRTTPHANTAELLIVTTTPPTSLLQNHEPTTRTVKKRATYKKPTITISAMNADAATNPATTTNTTTTKTQASLPDQRYLAERTDANY
jgi:hypothetical protein